MLGRAAVVEQNFKTRVTHCKLPVALSQTTLEQAMVLQANFFNLFTAQIPPHAVLRRRLG